MTDLSKEFKALFRSDDAVFNFILETALDGIAYRETKGDNNFWADDRFWKQLGYKRKKVKDDLEFWRSCMHREDAEREGQAFERFMANPEKEPYDLMLRFFHADGSTIWIQLKGQLIVQENKGLKRMLIAFNEISELKRQEEFLSRSSEMARIGFYDWNIRNKSLYWSKVTKEIHGVAEDFTPDYRSAIKFYKEGRSQLKITELVDRALHYGEPYDEELQIVDSEGKDKWVKAIGIPEIRDGITLRLYGLFQDIDLQVRTQNAIRSERSLYRQVLEGANLGAWDWDIDSDQMTLNRRAAEMLGFELEVMRREGRLYWFDFVHPDEAHQVKSEIQDYLVGRKDKFETDCRIQKSDGSYRWLSISGKLFQPDLHFDRPRLVGVWKDIHFERQKMDYYSTFIQEAPLAIAMLDRNMHYLNCSIKWRTDYGLEETKIIGESHYSIFPEIKPEWKEDHRRCLAGETLRKDEDPFLRSDGRLQWIKWEIRPWYDNENQVGGIIMYTEDITKSKEAEAKLAQSRQAFEVNFRNGAIGMAIIGIKGEWLDVNEKMCELLGYEAHELAKLTFQDLTYPEDLEKDLTEFERLNKGEIRNYQMEKRYIRKDGSILTAILAATALRDQNDEVAYYISQVIDCGKN